jgi:uncharacterized protein (UPF0548 family)
VLGPRRPSPLKLERLLARARLDQPSYPEVGATRALTLPDGYRHDVSSIELGRGPDLFPRAVAALRDWHVQRGAGIEVSPPDAWVDDRETVVLLIRVGPLWATAPCRVVDVVDERDRFSFAYGTLPGHPEVGEVVFSISRGATGVVSFGVVSFSRPAARLARLGAPLARRLQKRVTNAYLDALRDAV